jgi:hypothetical protein
VTVRTVHNFDGSPEFLAVKQFCAVANNGLNHIAGGYGLGFNPGPPEREKSVKHFFSQDLRGKVIKWFHPEMKRPTSPKKVC